jgi:hypothetical protein
MKKLLNAVKFTASDFDLMEGANYGATLMINGVHFHVTAIGVTREDDVVEAVDDPYDRFTEAGDLDPDVQFQTVKIPGLPHEYVIIITPFGD